MSGLGGGGPFRPAGSCPVAESLGSGAYMSHAGNPGSHLVADASTRDGTAAARIVLWRCVYCGSLLAGLGSADSEPDDDQEFTWMELPGGSRPG
jgi:hypothetical protein